MKPMNRMIATLALAGLVAPGIAVAKDSTGCGLGTVVFDGQSGIGPQVLAVTTNGTSGNQTFGISSGTLGCDPGGTVDSSAELAAFTADNLDRLAADTAAGGGETLVTVRALMGLGADDQAAFDRAMQASFDRIFASTSTSAADVLRSMEAVVAENDTLTTG